MAAVLAHELRNPLASLKGHAQLLARMLPTDGKEAQKADRVVAEATRMERLTTDLLDFARSAALRRASVDPTALLRASVEGLGAAVALDVDAAPARWSLDPQRMRQALDNVLRNAIQASPEGVEARARIAVERGRLVFEIEDEGPGIAEAELEQIFAPFHTRRVRGTGLGLAVARRVVEQHGGTIIASNRPEGGARFVIEVPAGAPATPDHESRPPIETPPDGS